MSVFDLTRLTPLMELTKGRPEIIIGLIDGTVAMNHPELATDNIRIIKYKSSAGCTQMNSAACMHGTFVAGILSAKINSSAPGICNNCTVLVRPIFSEVELKKGQIPRATPQDLAAAIVETIDSGARLLNVSAALALASSRSERAIEEAIEYAAKRGVIIVAAAGNQGTVGSTAITRHPWIIPIAACDLRGRPVSESNLGSSIGRRGLSAPGVDITSLGSNSESLTMSGTSVAAPFVTGAIALLWSKFPAATATEMKVAITRSYASRRATVVPPLLDAWGSYEFMKLPSGVHYQ